MTPHPRFTELASGLLSEGKSIRFRVSGGSMYPFIRDGYEVRVDPADISGIDPGDIVLCRSAGGSVFAHRVVGREDDGAERSLITKGDSSLQMDGSVHGRDLLGRVTAVYGEDGRLRHEGKSLARWNAFYAAAPVLGKTACLLVSGISRKLMPAHPCIPTGKDLDSVRRINSAIYGEAKDLINAFNSHGIRTILMKGILLARNVYSDTGLRPMTDIDVLVRVEDLPRADEIMASSGYPRPESYKGIPKPGSRSSINSIMYFPSDRKRPAVHMHWHILNSSWPIDRIVMKTDIGRIWSSAVPVSIAGVPSLSMSPEHDLIYLCYHAMQHSFRKPTMATDIVETVRCYRSNISWELMKDEARSFGLGFILYASLKYAARKTGFSLPEADRLNPEKSGAIEGAILNRMSRGRCGYAVSYAAFFSAHPGLRARALFFYRTVFPSREVMAHRLRISAEEVRPRDYINRMIGSAS